MDAFDADYGTFGICVWDQEVWIGPETKERVLSVPLLDITDCVAEIFPDYGLEEVFVLFGFDKDVSIPEWGLVISPPGKK